MPVTTTQIEQALRLALSPSVLHVRDDSHLHAGHEGAQQGGHFHVLIESRHFEGLGRVQRHRLVYDALHVLIPRGIHALAIDAC
jgi:BolA family transcriptional regulator, general stress-responsive regulator